MEESISNISVEPKVEPRKNFRKRFLIVFIIALLLLGALVVSAVFLDRLNISVLSKFLKNSEEQKVIPSGSESVFSALLKDTKEGTESYEVDFDKLDPTFKEEVSPLIYRGGEMFVNWGDPWSWQSSWIFGEIKDINDSEMVIGVIKPEGKGTIEVPYSCESNKTLLLARENLTILATNIKVYGYAKPGFLIYIHCLNEKCTEVGNGCVVVKMF